MRYIQLKPTIELKLSKELEENSILFQYSPDPRREKPDMGPITLLELRALPSRTYRVCNVFHSTAVSFLHPGGVRLHSIQNIV